jgi:hypothetical protein
MKLFAQQHRRLPRPRILSPWASDILAAGCLVIFFVALAALAVEVPDGPLRDRAGHITFSLDR